MKITCQNLSHIVQICAHFQIPINPAEISVSFPYNFHLLTVNGEKIEDENEYTFEQWINVYGGHSLTQNMCKRMNEWIKVEERLPESTVEVLCVGNKGKHQFVGIYTAGRDVEVAPDEDYSNDCEGCEHQDYCYLKPGWYEEEETPMSEYDYQYVHRDVTHWMPLPEPPKI